MDKTLDELLQCAETSGLWITLMNDPTRSPATRWIATRDGGGPFVDAHRHSPLAAVQALIIKAKLPILLQKAYNPQPSF